MPYKCCVQLRTVCFKGLWDASESYILLRNGCSNKMFIFRASKSLVQLFTVYFDGMWHVFLNLGTVIYCLFCLSLKCLLKDGYSSLPLALRVCDMPSQNHVDMSSNVWVHLFIVYIERSWPIFQNVSTVLCDMLPTTMPQRKLMHWNHKMAQYNVIHVCLSTPSMPLWPIYIWPDGMC